MFSARLCGRWQLAVRPCLIGAWAAKSNPRQTIPARLCTTPSSTTFHPKPPSSRVSSSPGLVLDNNTKETTIDVDLGISVSRSVFDLPCADRDTSFEEALVLHKLKRVRCWYWGPRSPRSKDFVDKFYESASPWSKSSHTGPRFKLSYAWLVAEPPNSLVRLLHFISMLSCYVGCSRVRDCIGAKLNRGL